MNNQLGTTSDYLLFVGVDISATTAAVSWTESQGQVTSPFTIEQTSKGYQTLQKKIAAAGFLPSQVLIVMEA